MKNALILHGTANNSKGNWFPWLAGELTRSGYDVWLPDLPVATNPDSRRYNSFLFSNNAWKFTHESLLVGHSSGGVAALKVLQELPQDSIVDTCVTVGAFVNTHGWDDIKGLFTEPFDFEVIRSHAKKFIIYHSDDDPYVPLDDAYVLQEKLKGELIIMKGQGHFNLEKGPQYRQFPELLEKILE